MSPAPYGQAGGVPMAGYGGGQLMGWNGQPLAPNFAEKKMLAGILGIVFGSLGVHKFILGYSTEGGIMLGATIGGVVLGTVLSFLILPLILLFAPMVMSIIGIIEGIMYLTKPDDEFVRTYGVNKKAWF